MSIASIFTLSTAQTAMELGCIYALVALALFLSYSILNIADLSTDSCFTLGCAVCCQVTLLGHPILALFAAMLAGVLSGPLYREPGSDGLLVHSEHFQVRQHLLHGKKRSGRRTGQLV